MCVIPIWNPTVKIGAITASKLEVKGYEQLTDTGDKITREGIKDDKREMKESIK